MSWGDLNGDGRSDYVDQKIFDTQINPYSGEYNSVQPGSSSGEAFSKIIGFVLMFFAAGAIVAFPIVGVLIAAFIIFIYVLLKKSNKRAEEEKAVKENLAAVESINEREKKLKGKWVCDKCGTINDSYLMTCSCGRSKLDSRGATYDEIEEKNKSKERILEEENEERLKQGGWRCRKCNKVNYSYETSCSCGFSKLDI